MTLKIPLIAADGSKSSITLSDPVISGTKVWPNASTTGYGSTVLTPATTNSLNVAGKTYSGLHFTGIVTIGAANITLENCLITANASDPWSLAFSGTLTGILVKNCTIIGAGKSTTQSAAAYGFYVNGNIGVTFDSCDISQVGQNAINNGNVIVQNCYVHNLNSGPGTHYECIYYGGAGGSNPNFSLLLQNNAFWNDQNTASVYIENYFGIVNNVTINSNLVVDSSTAGSYALYIEGNQAAHNITNVKVTNNAVGKGQFGYIILTQGLAPVYQVTKSGNYDYLTKVPV